MTRRRKFKLGDVVHRPAGKWSERDLWGVVVDHKMVRTVSYYYVLRSDEWGNRRGTGLWVKTDHLHPVMGKFGNPRHVKGAVQRFKYNQRLEQYGDRGCTCHCCGHRREDKHVRQGTGDA